MNGIEYFKYMHYNKMEMEWTPLSLDIENLKVRLNSILGQYDQKNINIKNCLNRMMKNYKDGDGSQIQRVERFIKHINDLLDKHLEIQKEIEILGEECGRAMDRLGEKMPRSYVPKDVLAERDAFKRVKGQDYITKKRVEVARKKGQILRGGKKRKKSYK